MANSDSIDQCLNIYEDNGVDNAKKDILMINSRDDQECRGQI